MYSIYDFPDIYDLILRSSIEQIEAEVTSIGRMLAQRGLERGRILDVACGTCAHGILLAQQGFEVAGIDRSPRMLEVAVRRAADAGVAIQLYQANIIDFDLDVRDFDAAIFMSETFPLLTEYDDIQSHFWSMRRHMRGGAPYIIDIDAHRHGVGTRQEVWGRRTHELENGSVEMWHEDFPGDWVKGTSHLVVHCRIQIGEETYETADDWRIRVDSPWNLSVFLKTIEGWSLEGFFSWRDLSPDISGEDHYFMVVS